MEQVMRYSIPTRLDAGDYGQVIKVVGDNETYELYVQVSKEEPCWIPVGKLLEKAFKNQFSDPLFINECLTLYQGKSDIQESLRILGNILQRN